MAKVNQPIMDNQIKFDLNTSRAMRGVALLMLLWHHLFFEKCATYSPLVCLSSNFTDVCVVIFVILSGYGLAVSVKDNPIGLIAFYKKRLPRLYLTYWLIALIFVPIGIFFGYRPLESVFQTSPYLKFFLQMTGFHMFMDEVGWGYNPTWWFMSLILALYLLFPLLYYLIRKFGVWFLLASFFLNFPPKEITKWFLFLNAWLFAFTLGIYLARTNGLVKLSMLQKRTGFFRFILLGGLILISVYVIRIVPWIYQIAFLQQRGFDWVHGLLIILLVFEIVQVWPKVKIPLCFLGDQLFNIFLFHTFIFYLYWPEFIYSFDNPISIFLVLLVICVIVSMALDYIKKILRFEKLLTWLDGIKLKEVIFIT